ncbi:MAG: hypothetical protein IJB24_04750 [Clostridia bacterium]|nr:hypothetical protein [Clostridia bacterium]MBQ4602152.1 hypothetical protein [Clostridia bacterium]
MKKNNDKKYPASLFVIGFIMNLTKNFLFFYPGLILLFIGIWSDVCLKLGLCLLLADVAVSLIEQIQIRNTVLNSDNPEFEKWQNAMLSEDWRENIQNIIESKTDETDDDKTEE